MKYGFAFAQGKTIDKISKLCCNCRNWLLASGESPNKLVLPISNYLCVLCAYFVLYFLLTWVLHNTTLCVCHIHKVLIWIHVSIGRIFVLNYATRTYTTVRVCCVFTYWLGHIIIITYSYPLSSFPSYFKFSLVNFSSV